MASQVAGCALQPKRVWCFWPRERVSVPWLRYSPTTSLPAIEVEKKTKKKKLVPCSKQKNGTRFCLSFSLPLKRIHCGLLLLAACFHLPAQAASGHHPVRSFRIQLLLLLILLFCLFVCRRKLHLWSTGGAHLL